VVEVIVLTYSEGLRVLIIIELIKETSVLMILMELIVLTSQSFIIKEGWFYKKEDDRGGYYIRLWVLFTPGKLLEDE
jgi:hypothetical protein